MKCPLCGKKLHVVIPGTRISNRVSCCLKKTCAASGGGRYEYWWRRLARQVKKLMRDTRKRAECIWFNLSECKYQHVGAICIGPCAVWEKGKSK